MENPYPYGGAGASGATAGYGGSAPYYYTPTPGAAGVTGSAGIMDNSGTAGTGVTAGSVAAAVAGAGIPYSAGESGGGFGGAAGAADTAGSSGDPGNVAGAGAGGAPGAGGATGSGGAAANGGAAGAGPTPTIPAPPAQCPTIATGNITVLSQQVQLWVGPAGRPGPIVFYWHGTGSSSSEASRGLGPGLAEIQSNGGVVASFTTTTGTGQNTGNGVWYTGDFEMADIILACAAQQGLVDTRQIFAGGCSAGGLQSSAMVYQRSSYLAGAMPNSGGTVFPPQLQDPSHVPAVMSTHGAAGVDVVVIDFSQTTATMTADLAAKGGFVVNCDHGGGHCQSPAEVKAAQWEFLKAHPFGYGTSPYSAGLPASFPPYCQIIY